MKEHVKNLEVVEEMLIVVDMVNGFCREGVLASPVVEGIIPEVKKTVEESLKKRDLVVFIKDTHDDDAVEFKRFGGTKHCLRGTSEAALVDELIPFEEKGISFEKNSTCYMFSKNEDYNFIEFLEKLMNLKKVKVCGCCTDICVTNGVLAMMNYFDEVNKNIEVDLLTDAIATYDAPIHNAETYEQASYLLLEQQGAKKVKKLGEMNYGK